MQLFVVEGYLDYSSQSDPIKYRFNTDITVPLLYSESLISTNKIRTNQVKRLDGSIEKFTDFEHQNSLQFEYYPTRSPAVCMFELANNYDYYEMYIDYQPIINSTRNLDTDSKEI